MSSIDVRLSDQDIDASFDLFDTDQSGKIDQDELQFALKSLGCQNFSKADVVAMMKHIDREGSGSIDKAGFRQLVREKTKTADSEGEILAAFKMFDINNAGKISYANLYDIAAKVNQDEPNEDFLRDLIKAADRDGDGEIGWEDWKYAMAWVHRKHGDTSVVSRWTQFGVASTSPRASRRKSVAEEKVTQLLNQAKSYEAPKSIVIAGTSVNLEPDGMVTRASAWAAVQELNPEMSESDFAMMFDQEDTDADNKVTLSQYKSLLTALGELE